MGDLSRSYIGLYTSSIINRANLHKGKKIICQFERTTFLDKVDLSIRWSGRLMVLHVPHFQDRWVEEKRCTYISDLLLVMVHNYANLSR